MSTPFRMYFRKEKIVLNPDMDCELLMATVTLTKAQPVHKTLRALNNWPHLGKSAKGIHEKGSNFKAALARKRQSDV